MRLTAKEVAAIKRAVGDVLGDGTEVRLFGSRVDDSARGGDVDLMVTVDHAVENPAWAMANVEAAQSGDVSDSPVSPGKRRIAVKLLPETRSRLAFLVRVVDKEIRHLDYADHQVFPSPLTLEAIQALEDNAELALKLEAFTSRFCRLQDTLGDKLLPALLKALGEPAAAFLINLDKAQKYGWLASAETPGRRANKRSGQCC